MFYTKKSRSSNLQPGQGSSKFRNARDQHKRMKIHSNKREEAKNKRKPEVVKNPVKKMQQPSSQKMNCHNQIFIFQFGQVGNVAGDSHGIHLPNKSIINKSINNLNELQVNIRSTSNSHPHKRAGSQMKIQFNDIPLDDGFQCHEEIDPECELNLNESKIEKENLDLNDTWDDEEFNVLSEIPTEKFSGNFYTLADQNNDSKGKSFIMKEVQNFENKGKKNKSLSYYNQSTLNWQNSPQKKEKCMKNNENISKIGFGHIDESTIKGRNQSNSILNQTETYDLSQWIKKTNFDDQSPPPSFINQSNSSFNHKYNICILNKQSLIGNSSPTKSCSSYKLQQKVINDEKFKTPTNETKERTEEDENISDSQENTPSIHDINVTFNHKQYKNDSPSSAENDITDEFLEEENRNINCTGVLPYQTKTQVNERNVSITPEKSKNQSQLFSSPINPFIIPSINQHGAVLKTPTNSKYQLRLLSHQTSVGSEECDTIGDIDERKGENDTELDSLFHSISINKINSSFTHANDISGLHKSEKSTENNASTINDESTKPCSSTKQNTYFQTKASPNPMSFGNQNLNKFLSAVPYPTATSKPYMPFENRSKIISLLENKFQNKYSNKITNPQTHVQTSSRQTKIPAKRPTYITPTKIGVASQITEKKTPMPKKVISKNNQIPINSKPTPSGKIPSRASYPKHVTISLAEEASGIKVFKSSENTNCTTQTTARMSVQNGYPQRLSGTKRESDIFVKAIEEGTKRAIPEKLEVPMNLNKRKNSRNNEDLKVVSPGSSLSTNGFLKETFSELKVEDKERLLNLKTTNKTRQIRNKIQVESNSSRSNTPSTIKIITQPDRLSHTKSKGINVVVNSGKPNNRNIMQLVQEKIHKQDIKQASTTSKKKRPKNLSNKKNSQKKKRISLKEKIVTPSKFIEERKSRQNSDLKNNEEKKLQDTIEIVDFNNLHNCTKKEGVLMKKSGSMIGKSFKERFCVLENRKFNYYKNSQRSRVSGSLDFDLLSCSFLPEKKANPLLFQIKVQSSSKKFIFKTKNSAEFQSWKKHICAHIAASKGAEANLKGIVSYDKEFWKFNRISLAQFRKYADTGDILLFTGTTFTCKLQRVLTRSKYDHVAIILRYSDGRLIMLEATGQMGVSLCSWDDFVECRWHQYYSRISFRHLNYKRDLDTIVKLEKFVKKVIGRKFKINPAKLLRRHSTTDSGDNMADNKSFFCSELVASVYKLMGLLPETVSASQYWPVSFSAEKTLPLLKDAKLGEEKLIDFSL